MAMYLGDFPVGGTVYFCFTTTKQEVPTTLTGGTVVVRKNDTAAPLTLDPAPVLTANFNSITGLNNVKVSLADADFVAGEYDVCLSAGSVDSVSWIGQVLAHFSITNRVEGAAGAGLTAIPWNASWDAQVESEVTDALTAADVSTATALAAIHTHIDDIHDTDLPAIKTVVDDIHNTDLPAVKTVVDDIHNTDLPAVKTVVDDIHNTDLPAVKTDTGAIKTQTDHLSFVTGTGAQDIKATLDSEKVTVTSMDTDVISAASVSAAAVTKIQAGLSTGTELTTTETELLDALTSVWRFGVRSSRTKNINPGR